MRVRVSSLILAILFVPAAAFADFHKIDFSGGGSGGTGGSNVYGFQQSLAWGVRFDKWKCASCGFVLPDVSVQFGKHEDASSTKTGVTQVVYQGGFRWTPTSLVSRQRDKHEDAQTKVFIQVLAGAAYTNNGPANSGTDSVITLGGGIQYFLHKEDRMKRVGATLTPEPHCAGFGFQAQLDKVWRSDREGFWRLSGGVVYRVLHPSDK